MKTLVGTVVSNKMEKTVVVKLKRIMAHPLYGKRIRRYKRVKAHYQNFKLKEGDMVRIVQTRPISKDKSFKVIEVIKNKTIDH